MSVKVFITRYADRDQHELILPLLVQLRGQAMKQPGYISGKTMINCEDENETLVISKWKNYEDWETWKNSNSRRIIQDEIDTVINSPTTYKAFTFA